MPKKRTTTNHRVVAMDRMTAAERATFVRALATATLRWALDDLEQEPSAEGQAAKEHAAPKPESISSSSATPRPWLTASEASALKRGRKFVLREIKSGRLRGAIVGGRREILTRAEWCDQWVEDHTKPVPIAGWRKGRA